MTVANEDSFSISILLITYNHEKHIERALESILSQVIPSDLCPVEIVVADDASSDRTLEIVRLFDGRDSRFVFNYLPAQRNIGVTRNYQRGFAACKGSYVAVLEGDDYWSSSEKLKKQIQVLDANSGCALCSVNYNIYYERDKKFIPRVSSSKGWRNIEVSELIAENIIGNFSTCMYRRSALCQLPKEAFNIKSYDWIVNILVGSVGEIIFLHEPMSVYRIHDGGVWSALEGSRKLKMSMDVIPSYDVLTGGRYRSEFTTLLRNLERDYAAMTEGALSRRKGPLSRLWKKIKTRVRGKSR